LTTLRLTPCMELIYARLEVPSPQNAASNTFRGPRQFIPHLSSLRAKLTRDLETDTDRHRSLHWALEALPYCLAANYNALVTFVEVQADVIERNAQGLRGGTILVLSADQTDRLNFAIDAFLETACRAQNTLSPYLRRTLRRDYADSLSDLIKKLEKGPVRLPDAIAEILVGYWRTHGERLRHYRDLSQHFALVASESRIFLAEDGTPGSRLLLPSNPEVKSNSALSFGKPPIHAQHYLREQFLKLYGILFCVTKILDQGLPGEPKQFSVAFPRVPLLTGERTDGSRPRVRPV